MTLRQAARTGNLDELLRLIQAGADIHEKSKPSTWSEGGNTALHAAVNDNQVQAAELLLGYGANPNERGSNPWFPLDQAVRLKSLDMFYLLLRHGARPAPTDESGSTILHRIAENGLLTMAKVMVEGPYGIEINARTRGGWTPLRCAIQRKHPRVAAYLRSKGAVE